MFFRFSVVGVCRLVLLLTVLLTLPSGGALAFSEISLSAFQREGYDDNVLLADEDKEDDISHLTRLVVGLNVSNESLLAELDSQIQFTRYSENDFLDYVAANSNLRFSLKPGASTSLDVLDRFVTTEDYDIAVEQLSKLQLGALERQRRYENDLSVRLNREVTARSLIHLSCDYYLQDVEINRELDEDIISVGTGLSYGFGRMNRHSLDSTLRYTHYSFEENTPDETKRGFSTVSVIAGSELDLSPRTRLKIYGGVARSEDPDRDSLSDESYYGIGGAAYKADLRYASAEVKLDHELSTEGGLGQLMVRDKVLLRATANITPQLMSTFWASYSDSESDDSNILNRDRSYGSSALYADLKYEKNDKYTTKLSCTYYKSDYANPIDAGIYDYEQWTAALETGLRIFEHLTLRLGCSHARRKTVDKAPPLQDINFERNEIWIMIGII